MNEEQKIQEKIDKFARQLSLTAFKMILLSKENAIFVRGNGLYITIKKENAIERIEDNVKDAEVGEEKREQGKGESEEKCDCETQTEGKAKSCEKVSSNKQEKKPLITVTGVD